MHPAKAGINSNLNLITDHGNIYSFTLTDVTASGAEPDLKVIVIPADESSIAAAAGPAQLCPPPNSMPHSSSSPSFRTTRRPQSQRRWMSIEARIP